MTQRVATIDDDGSDRLVPDPKVCERYDVCSMTIRRWDKNKNLGFPAAIRINSRKYRRLSELVRWERSRATERTA